MLMSHNLMNPQFKKFADIATQSFSHTYNFECWAELFAELLVTECAIYVDDNISCDECNNVYPVEGLEILDHFGISE